MASNGKSELQHVEHGFGPCYFPDSEILILGSFPSVKSREKSFYYGHPMNRFWAVLARFFDFRVPDDIDGKRDFLKHIHIALYDVIESCDIRGSSDLSIKNAIPTDLSKIIKHSKIRLILLNGKKAGAMFEKFQLPIIGNEIPYFVMPSTSPANAAVPFDELFKLWAAKLKAVE